MDSLSTIDAMRYKLKIMANIKTNAERRYKLE